jgi:hypothetical protein
MLAGGMVIAAPSMVPTAAAAGALYVSAENAQFDNLFAGPMVIEVIVKDPNRSRTDIAAGEPTVLVDNQRLRLAQGIDGNWYGYFADNTDVATVHALKTSANDYPLMFGTDADPSRGAGSAALQVYSSNTYSSITTQSGTLGGDGVIDNPPALSNYNSTLGASAACDACGQIGIVASNWPFLQTFDFTQGDFDVKYEQAGNDEIVTLDHSNDDIDDYASLTLDRTSATQDAQVMLFIVDQALNIDPTDEDIVVFKVAHNGSSTGSGVSWTNGTIDSRYKVAGTNNYTAASDGFGFDDNGKLLIDMNAAGATVNVLEKDATIDDIVLSQTTGFTYLVFFEDADNTGTFSNVDDADDANLEVKSLAKRGTTATFDYNDSAQSFTVANDFGTIDMDESSVGDEWNSGENLVVTLTDQDLNKNTLSDEDMTLRTHNTTIPAMIIGSPITLHDDSMIGVVGDTGNMTVSAFNKIGTITDANTVSGSTNANVTVTFNGTTVAQYRTAATAADFIFVNYNVTQVVEVVGGVSLAFDDGSPLLIEEDTSGSAGLLRLDNTIAAAGTAAQEAGVLLLNFTQTTGGLDAAVGETLFVDIFTFGDKTGYDRQNNAIYRLLLEETGDNTGVFIGDVEYLMLNQINYDVATTYSTLDTLSDEISIIVHEDLTDEDAPRINYLDLGADGVSTQIADQVAAPSHSGVVTFDNDNYKTADTVVVTLDDQDLNTDSELVDVYITSTSDHVGENASDATSYVLDITFNDVLWQSGEDAVSSTYAGSPDDGLEASGFTLVETGIATGLFTGSFQVPSTYYDSARSSTTAKTHTTTGTDIEVNYNDHRDASGETIEVGAGASINANTGSVAFDRTVYPVPWGNETAGERFALHSSAANLDGGSTENALAQGNVVVHVRVSDADYDVSAFGEDTIADTTVVLKIERGSESVTVATFGNAATPILETSPTSGVFEHDQKIEFTSGPSGTTCPAVFLNTGCVLQGDIITVTYSDVKDASGQAQTVTDSATFDLRNGVLQADKSVYLIGSDMILTLIEPDFDLDNDGAESYTLDLIEWDSDAAETSMGPKGLGGESGSYAAFDPEPSALRETGDSTGIFQVVIEIPDTLNSESLDRGEKIDLEYTDWGPAGADYVGQEDEDIGLTVYTSNFGATIELDQKVYTWTDKVYITVVAPDHNFDSNLVDEIGNTSDDPLKVSTRGNQLANYKLVESGADTGIFIGEVTLKGFIFDADGDGVNDITATASALTTGNGPTEGQLATTDNDGLTVSFEFSEDETVVGSALIRWNIGEVQWLEASYPASGTGVVRIIDADMNLNPEAIDNFAVDAWSDSDAGGIDLTVTETNEATGIFEGTVFFTTANDSSGHRLRVAEGDTVTAEYEDNTLPEPYTTADELDITATTLIGTIVPPLERAPAANLRTVDAFGNSLNSVSVDQQVQISADLANGQDREQSFAYLVQIQDGDGVTVSLAWITGSLSSGQSFSPALSWIPTESGSYTATAFVWESVDNPTALSPPVSTTISVQ